MTSTPTLSYKKGTSTQRSSPSIPSSPQSNNMSKKESRRRALQEFYHLQKEEAKASAEQAEQAEKAEEVHTNEQDTIDPSEIPSLETPEELHQYIQTHTIEDILKFKKSMVNKYNTNNSVKKSIIYDNYYELIKLNQTLDTLSKPKPPSKPISGLGIIENDESEQVDAGYFDEVLNDLSSFIKTENKVFGHPFEEVIQNLK